MTGVQTCALPIFSEGSGTLLNAFLFRNLRDVTGQGGFGRSIDAGPVTIPAFMTAPTRCLLFWLRITTAVVAIAWLGAAQVWAQDSPAPDFKGFFDKLVTAQMNTHHVAGAVVAVVQDGGVVFESGYGFADVAAQRPVDPRRTLFRVASNSKMFVWTAVMQLVERGQLDLHADINTYLRGVQIPKAFDEPITLEHLMTHTAGFEDRMLGLFSQTPGAVRPLPELLRETPRDRKSTRLNSSHVSESRMPSSA